MSLKLLVANARKFDAYPPRVAHVDRSIKFFWVAFDQRRLNPYSSQKNNCDETIILVIERAHRENFFLHEERRFAVGEFLPTFPAAPDINDERVRRVSLQRRPFELMAVAFPVFVSL